MKKFNAYAVYLVMGGVSAFAGSMVYTVAVVYYVQMVKMDPLHLVLVGTAMELMGFLFEVPTGIVADAYSRRLSVIIGQFLVGIGFLMQGVVPVFLIIIGAQAVTGVGYTFISGALDAWITDEMGTGDIGRVFARGGQAGTIGALLGIGAGTGLALVQLTLPFYVGGTLMVLLAVGLVLVMPEHGFKPASRGAGESWRAPFRTFRYGVKVVRGSSLLIILLATGVAFGTFSEGLDRLWQAHFLNDIGFPSLGALQPVAWFGIINVVEMLLSFVAAEFVRRRVDMSERADTGRTLFVLNGLMGAGVVLLGLAGNFPLALGAWLLTSIMRTMGGPVYGAWLNQNIRSEVRATVLSMSSQANALGQFALGPVVGLIGSLYSIRAALVVSGLLITPALALFTRTFKRRDSASTVPLVPQDGVTGT